ncbi:hypothetical protein BC830DRAFT_693785 [Chytriomyces sp. MP71]|nr:hypothetical protein BC830DRAFT_693785 [Chytriomyces sp. MP71]
MLDALFILFYAAIAAGLLSFILFSGFVGFIIWFEIVKRDLCVSRVNFFNPVNRCTTTMMATTTLLLVSEAVKIHFQMGKVDEDWVKSVVYPIQAALIAIFELSYIHFSWQKGNSAVRHLYPNQVNNCRIVTLCIFPIICSLSVIAEVAVFELNEKIHQPTWHLLQCSIYGINALLQLIPIIFELCMLRIFHEHMTSTMLMDGDKVDAQFQIIFQYGKAVVLFACMGFALSISSFVVLDYLALVTAFSITTYIDFICICGLLFAMKRSTYKDKLRKDNVQKEKIKAAIGKEEMERLRLRSIDAHASMIGSGQNSSDRHVHSLCSVSMRSMYLRSGSSRYSLDGGSINDLHSKGSSKRPSSDAFGAMHDTMKAKSVTTLCKESNSLNNGVGSLESIKPLSIHAEVPLLPPDRLKHSKNLCKTVSVDSSSSDTNSQLLDPDRTSSLKRQGSLLITSNDSSVQTVDHSQWNWTSVSTSTSAPTDTIVPLARSRSHASKAGPTIQLSPPPARSSRSASTSPSHSTIPTWDTFGKTPLSCRLHRRASSGGHPAPSAALPLPSLLLATSRVMASRPKLPSQLHRESSDLGLPSERSDASHGSSAKSLEPENVDAGGWKGWSVSGLTQQARAGEDASVGRVKAVEGEKETKVKEVVAKEVKETKEVNGAQQMKGAEEVKEMEQDEGHIRLKLRRESCKVDGRRESIWSSAATYRGSVETLNQQVFDATRK